MDNAKNGTSLSPRLKAARTCSRIIIKNQVVANVRWFAFRNLKVLFSPLVFNLLSFRPLERSFGTYEINYAKRENATMEIGSWNHSNGQISVSHHPAHNDDEISMSWTQISVCKTEQKISLALISSLYFEARFISLDVLESESSWIVLMILWWMKKRIYVSSRVMLWALRERFKSRLLMMLDPLILMVLMAAVTS